MLILYFKKRYLNRIRKPRLKIIKKWCHQILSGLQYLHEQEPYPIIHRDIKCENIFVNTVNNEIRIGDLGLALTLKSDYTSSVLGTPEFMAPEIYEEKYGTPVDIYAFGMCLLEMATLQVPYKECTSAAQIYKKVSQGIQPQSLQLIQNDSLKNFILKCIQNYELRPSAAQLLQDDFFKESEIDNLPIQLSSDRIPTSMSNTIDSPQTLQQIQKNQLIQELQHSQVQSSAFKKNSQFESPIHQMTQKQDNQESSSIASKSSLSKQNKESNQKSPSQSSSQSSEKQQIQNQLHPSAQKQDSQNSLSSMKRSFNSSNQSPLNDHEVNLKKQQQQDGNTIQKNNSKDSHNQLEQSINQMLQEEKIIKNNQNQSMGSSDQIQRVQLKVQRNQSRESISSQNSQLESIKEIKIVKSEQDDKNKESIHQTIETNISSQNDLSQRYDEQLNQKYEQIKVENNFKIDENKNQNQEEYSATDQKYYVNKNIIYSQNGELLSQVLPPIEKRQDQDDYSLRKITEDSKEIQDDDRNQEFFEKRKFTELENLSQSAINQFINSPPQNISFSNVSIRKDTLNEEIYLSKSAVEDLHQKQQYVSKEAYQQKYVNSDNIDEVNTNDKSYQMFDSSQSPISFPKKSDSNNMIINQNISHIAKTPQSDIISKEEIQLNNLEINTTNQMQLYPEYNKTNQNSRSPSTLKDSIFFRNQQYEQQQNRDIEIQNHQKHDLANNVSHLNQQCSDQNEYLQHDQSDFSLEQYSNQSQENLNKGVNFSQKRVSPQNTTSNQDEHMNQLPTSIDHSDGYSNNDHNHRYSTQSSMVENQYNYDLEDSSHYQLLVIEEKELKNQKYWIKFQFQNQFICDVFDIDNASEDFSEESIFRFAQQKVIEYEIQNESEQFSIDLYNLVCEKYNQYHNSVYSGQRKSSNEESSSTTQSQQFNESKILEIFSRHYSNYMKEISEYLKFESGYNLKVRQSKEEIQLHRFHLNQQENQIDYETQAQSQTHQKSLSTNQGINNINNQNTQNPVNINNNTSNNQINNNGQLNSQLPVTNNSSNNSNIAGSILQINSNLNTQGNIQSHLLSPHSSINTFEENQDIQVQSNQSSSIKRSGSIKVQATASTNNTKMSQNNYPQNNNYQITNQRQNQQNEQSFNKNQHAMTMTHQQQLKSNQQNDNQSSNQSNFVREGRSDNKGISHSQSFSNITTQNIQKISNKNHVKNDSENNYIPSNIQNGQINSNPGYILPPAHKKQSNFQQQQIQYSNEMKHQQNPNFFSSIQQQQQTQQQQNQNYQHPQQMNQQQQQHQQQQVQQNINQNPVKYPGRVSVLKQTKVQYASEDTFSQSKQDQQSHHLKNSSQNQIKQSQSQEQFFKVNKKDEQTNPYQLNQQSQQKQQRLVQSQYQQHHQQYPSQSNTNHSNSNDNEIYIRKTSNSQNSFISQNSSSTNPPFFIQPQNKVEQSNQLQGINQNVQQVTQLSNQQSQLIKSLSPPLVSNRKEGETININKNVASRPPSSGQNKFEKLQLNEKDLTNQQIQNQTQSVYMISPTYSQCSQSSSKRVSDNFPVSSPKQVFSNPTTNQQNNQKLLQNQQMQEEIVIDYENQIQNPMQFSFREVQTTQINQISPNFQSQQQQQQIQMQQNYKIQYNHEQQEKLQQTNNSNNHQQNKQQQQFLTINQTNQSQQKISSQLNSPQQQRNNQKPTQNIQQMQIVQQQQYQNSNQQSNQQLNNNNIHNQVQSIQQNLLQNTNNSSSLQPQQNTFIYQIQNNNSNSQNQQQMNILSPQVKKQTQGNQQFWNQSMQQAQQTIQNQQYQQPLQTQQTVYQQSNGSQQQQQTAQQAQVIIQQLQTQLQNQQQQPNLHPQQYNQQISFVVQSNQSSNTPPTSNNNNTNFTQQSQYMSVQQQNQQQQIVQQNINQQHNQQTIQLQQVNNGQMTNQQVNNTSKFSPQKSDEEIKKIIIEIKTMLQKPSMIKIERTSHDKVKDESDIKLIQRSLKFLLPSQQILENGHFGNYTEQMIKIYQKQHNINIHGIIEVDLLKSIITELENQLTNIENKQNPQQQKDQNKKKMIKDIQSQQSKETLSNLENKLYNDLNLHNDGFN